ncbi:MAG: hypothetical protein P4L16_08395, partial [Chlamydiales bacterium]|nr:hypothetical protein [Chlamydiales bacterium]
NICPEYLFRSNIEIKGERLSCDELDALRRKRNMPLLYAGRYRALKWKNAPSYFERVVAVIKKFFIS